MEDTQDFIATQTSAAPDTIAGNGQTPSPVADTAEAALPQERSLQNFAQQTLEPITGTLGPISPAQFMTLSGNACKLYIFCWNAEWVVIPLQQDRLPFGVGLQDIRTVLRVIHELWQHRCIDVKFDETEVDNPLGLRAQGKSVVLKAEGSVQPIERIFVRCVGFPEEMPEEVAQSLNGKLKRQIDYHQQRVRDLQQEKAWWERRMRRQSANRDSSQSAASGLAGNEQSPEAE